jgi:hypothetical protein
MGVPAEEQAKVSIGSLLIDLRCVRQQDRKIPEDDCAFQGATHRLFRIAAPGDFLLLFARQLCDYPARSCL